REISLMRRWLFGIAKRCSIDRLHRRELVLDPAIIEGRNADMSCSDDAVAAEDDDNPARHTARHIRAELNFDNDGWTSDTDAQAVQDSNDSGSGAFNPSEAALVNNRNVLTALSL